MKGSLSDNEPRSINVLKNSVNKMRPIAAQKILKTARYVLKAPTATSNWIYLKKTKIKNLFRYWVKIIYDFVFVYTAVILRRTTGYILSYLYLYFQVPENNKRNIFVSIHLLHENRDFIRVSLQDARNRINHSLIRLFCVFWACYCEDSHHRLWNNQSSQFLYNCFSSQWRASAEVSPRFCPCSPS